MQVQRVLEGDVDTVNLMHALGRATDGVFRVGDLHNAHEVNERLQQDELVLITGVDLVLQLRVEAEVVHQLLVMNRQHRHRCIEVLLDLMQTKVDGFEVDLQLGSVLLLLRNLLLLLVADLLLKLLGSLLCQTGLLLTLLALGLFDLVISLELL